MQNQLAPARLIFNCQKYINLILLLTKPYTRSFYCQLLNESFSPKENRPRLKRSKYGRTSLNIIKNRLIPSKEKTGKGCNVLSINEVQTRAISLITTDNKISSKKSTKRAYFYIPGFSTYDGYTCNGSRTWRRCSL